MGSSFMRKSGTLPLRSRKNSSFMTMRIMKEGMRSNIPILSVELSSAELLRKDVTLSFMLW